MHILIVDDAADMRRSLQVLLNHVGYSEVSVADSGAAALEFLRNQPDVDVVLLDVMMPLLNGIETCRRIKAHSDLRDIPVVMVSAVSDEENLCKAFEAGAMDYLTKPVRFTELIARLRSALSLKQERDNRRRREAELLRVTQLLEEANESLQRLASIDELTGLANRRTLDQHLEREWRRCSRSEAWLSVLMADVDLFKNYNDHYGHQAGDECLQRIAGVLQSGLRRAGDLAARFGGEEFLLVLPGADPAGLAARAEKLRSDVEQLAIAHADSSVAPHVTISLGGAAVIPRHAGGPENLVSLADAALYEAKHAGRDRVRIRHSSTPAEFAASS
jgi:diguanylate cyclase (GGDEF)-like protein